MDEIKVGIVGLGANTRLRHVPGLMACDAVKIVGVCNRSPESTAKAASEYGIPQTYERWEDLVVDPSIDAVVVGTWPYLHEPITVAALNAEKHVLTEARMARNFEEAERMLTASREHPNCVAQIVPSPFGLSIHKTVCRMLNDGYLGELREFLVLGTNASSADPNSPLHWRQNAELNGINKLGMGILHETLIRWIPDPVDVFSSEQTFTQSRVDQMTGETAAVTSPETVQLLTRLPNGAHGAYYLSSAIHHGPPPQIQLYGSKGTLHCLLGDQEQLLAARHDEPELRPVDIPPSERGGWRVEAEFIGAIRGQEEVKFTDFDSGIRYMRFTEAVENSQLTGSRCALPEA